MYYSVPPQYAYYGQQPPIMAQRFTPQRFSPRPYQPQQYRQSPPREPLTVVNGPVFALDVECVANGTTHNDRVVAHIALVGADDSVLINTYVKPDVPIVSYIEPLTALTEELVQGGIPLAEAVEQVRKVLPANAILVGQNILKDVQWLGLVESKDFQGMLDLAGLYRVFNHKYKNYAYHSLHHKAKALLHIDQGTEAHTADKDALLSMWLFKLYLELEKVPDALEQAKQTLIDTPLSPTFVKRHPSYEGVCMGGRKTCTCRAPFFF
jgi:RNA exonuclease 4